jgi:hypothetical protein
MFPLPILKKKYFSFEQLINLTFLPHLLSYQFTFD